MFSLEQAQSWIDGSRLVGDPHYEVQRVCTDSRDAKAGDLFVPLVGERFDAHAFIGQVSVPAFARCLVPKACRPMP